MSVPPPPAQQPRQRRHRMSTVLLVRRLYGQGDSWTPGQIRRYLAEQEGIEVSLHTIWRWAVPGVAEQQRAQNNESYRRRRDRLKRERPEPVPATESILGRMLELRAAGASFTGVAAAIGVYHGIRMTPEMARYYVRSHREPVLPKRKATA